MVNKKKVEIWETFYQVLKMDNPESDLELFLRKCVEVMEADAGTITLWETEIGFFNTIVNIDPSFNLKGMILIPDQGGLDGRIFRERSKPYIALSNYTKNMDAYAQLKPLNFSFAVGVPLFSRKSELIASMCFYFKERTQKIQKNEEDLLKEIRLQTEVLILNARLYQELEKAKNNEEQSSNFLDLLLNSSPDIIINTDLTGKIKFWNQAAQKATKFSASEMMKRKLPLIQGSNEEKFYQLFNEVRRGKDIQNKTFRFYIKDAIDKKKSSKSRIITLSLIPIFNHKDSVNSILITGQDISEQKELKEKVEKYNKELSQKDSVLAQKEQILQHTQQNLIISEKLATIGILSNKLNHQINNPLMIMMSTLSYLQEEGIEIQENYLTRLKEGKQNVDEKTLLNFIKDVSEELKDVLYTGDRIKQVLKELRNFSEIIKEKHFRENTDFIEVINQTLVFIKENYDLKNINIKIEKKINKAKLYGNFRQLQFIIQILFDNALLAIANRNKQPKKGEIRLIVENFTLNQKNHVRFIIKDNGIGMTKEQISKLFEPFYTNWQNSQSGLKKNEKLLDPFHIGLNLATAQIILENHRAKITITSNYELDKAAHGKIQESGTAIILDFPLS
ncbi:MAG: ATP-binding protein [Promethearchaeota archaeon]